MRYYLDACPVENRRFLYGVLPEDLEEAVRDIDGKKGVWLKQVKEAVKY